MNAGPMHYVLNAAVDAPTALFSGSGQSGESFCALFGTTELYDNST
jgi:hypothetical protein